MFRDPTFYLAISFVIFAILIGRPIVAFILKALDKRRLTIKSLIEVAAKTLEDAKKFLELTKKQQTDTLDQIKAIKKHSSFESERVKSESLKKLEETILREELLTSEQITRAENQAIKDIKHEAVRIAILATRKILEDGLDKQANSSLVDQALDEIEGMDLKLAK